MTTCKASYKNMRGEWHQDILLVESPNSFNSIQCIYLSMYIMFNMDVCFAHKPNKGSDMAYIHNGSLAWWKCIANWSNWKLSRCKLSSILLGISLSLHCSYSECVACKCVSVEMIKVQRKLSKMCPCIRTCRTADWRFYPMVWLAFNVFIILYHSRPHSQFGSRNLENVHSQHAISWIALHSLSGWDHV